MRGEEEGRERRHREARRRRCNGVGMQSSDGARSAQLARCIPLDGALENASLLFFAFPGTLHD